MNLNVHDASSPLIPVSVEPEIKISKEEREWVTNVIEQIKSPENIMNVEKIVSQHVKNLNSFEPDKIIHLVSLLDQSLKLESKDRKINAYLSKEAASLIVRIGHEEFKPLFIKSKDKQLAIDVVIQLAITACIPLLVIDTFPQYGLDKSTPEGQKALIGIAKQEAQQNGERTSKHIDKYGIDKSTLEGQKALIDIAKLAAQQNGEGTSEHIENYGIDKSTQEGQKVLIEIAKLAAQQNGAGTSEHIENYGINKSTLEGQKALIEIAKLAAQQNGEGTSCYIEKYGIDKSTTEGQKALIEIAKLAAQQNGRGTSGWIKNYGIDKFPDGQKVLIEIAKLVAQQSGYGISYYIEKYGIDKSTLDGQKALIEIAKLAAKRDGWGTSEHIKKYGIDKFPDGQKALIEIAKLAAQQNGRRTSECIENYGIDKSTSEGQKALIEIAKLVAQQSGYGISYYIEKYGIDKSTSEGQKALIEIAILAAQRDGIETFAHIEKYGIDKSTSEGQKALIEVAKLAAKQNGGTTSYYIKKYGIDKSTPEGQEALIEIAKLAAQNDCFGTSKYIQNYGIDRSSIDGIESYEELTRFMFNCIVKQQSSFSQETYKSNFKFFQNNVCPGSSMRYSLDFSLFDSSFEKLAAGELQEALKKGLETCRKKFEMQEKDLLWVQESLNRNENVFHQKRFLEWFLVTACLCSTSKNLRELFKTQQKTLKSISKLHPILREAMVKEFIYLSTNHNTAGFEKLKKASGDMVHTKLACLVLANFPAEGEDVYIKALKTLTSERMFREGKNQKLLLETLLKIKESSLEASSKADLIKKLFSLPENERLPSLRLVSDLLAFKGEAYLLRFSSLIDLQNALSELFTEKLNITVDDFYQKYEKTVGSWRNKEALTTYLGKLNELPSNQKEIALPLFKELFTKVLNGRFQQDRYKVDQNPHLAEIQQNHPKIFERWQQEVKLTPAEIEKEIGKDTKEIPVAERVIKTLKLALEQNHLGGEKQNELYPELSACAKNWDKIGESLENLAKELALPSDKKPTAEQSAKKKALQLQKMLMEIIQTPENLEKKLNDIKSKISQETQFYRDIVEAEKMLKTAHIEKPASYQVIDTDHPNHIMLMGTEVLNSCQTVHGIPDLNVCLLGYFLDGKHRLDLVCDDQGKIVARSVLRLLIDAQGQPVLFQERVYVADAAPEYSNLLRKLAKKKAESLGVPLVISKIDFEKEEAKPYPLPIHAKQKPVPFEYVDALGSKQAGDYVIQNALQIF